VAFDDQRTELSERAHKQSGVSTARTKFIRATSRLWRKFAALRTIDLDSAAQWPNSATVIERDEFGPLVIAVANATVFPDGSVKSGGRWLTSERFGLTPPRRPATETIGVDRDCGFVQLSRLTQIDVLESFAPRVATLGRLRPGLPVVVPSVRFPLAATLAQCAVTLGGVAIPGGAARRVTAALFARVPTINTGDAQFRLFAESLVQPEHKLVRKVYLENDNVNNPSTDTSIIGDIRFAHEKSGSELISLRRFGGGDIIRIAKEIVIASHVTMESESLRPFAAFASRTAEVTVAPVVATGRRDANRITATSRFDMDKALRRGAPLPRGVEVVSQPDYQIPDTDVSRHSVFDNGRWRTQSADVLVERSLGPWIVSVKNAILAPNGSVILEDGTVLGGTYFGEPSPAFTFDGWIAAESDGPVGFALLEKRGFGHGLLQIAPRLDALSRFDANLDLLVPQFGWNIAPLVERLGIPVKKIHHVSQVNQQHFRRVPQLFVSTQLHPESRTARADPVWLNDFVERFTSATPPTAPRKVYLARDNFSGRRGGCVNREILDEVAEQFGYDRVVPETLSFPDQIALVSSTTHMLGERGSALNWAGFMPTGSEVVMLNGVPETMGKNAVTFHNPVMAARGSVFNEINAMRAGTHRHFEVDPALLRRAMSGLHS
jgi:hypothetical protein